MMALKIGFAKGTLDETRYLQLMTGTGSGS
jgi:hypothetical protein